MAVTSDTFKLAFGMYRQAICLLIKQEDTLVINKTFADYLNIKVTNEDGCHNISWSEIFPELTTANVSVGQIYAFKYNISNKESKIFNLSFEEIDNNLMLGTLIDSVSTEREFHDQRIKTLGTIAGTVAHDFNNVLTGILGHISFLKAILPAKGQHVESLLAVEDGSRKAAELIQQILSFSRLKVAEQKTSVDLRDLIAKTTALLKVAVTARHKFEVVLPEKPVMVMGVEAKLAQILVNLVMNSKSALEQSGLIRVLLDIGYTNGSQQEPLAVLRVVDNGCGIADEALERIFEPYYSTRADGNGLGLATVDRIVHEFNGTIDIKSKVDFGTTITIKFPLIDCVSEVAQQDQIALSAGQEKILIIDDEDAVRNVITLSLRHLGYQVEVASSGHEALDLIASLDDLYDLVLLDMLMPHLSGEETFMALQKIKPGTKVLIISGYASDDAIQNVLNSGACGFIQKPFTIEQLSTKVRQCIDNNI